MNLSWRVLLSLCMLVPAARAQEEKPDPVRTVRLFDAEVRIAEFWREESARARPHDVVIEHATVLPMTGAPALEDHSVTVRDGRIVAIAPAADAAAPEGALRIDGRDRFLMPGLVDMHVHHLASMAADLLLLLNGVTAVRDMDGFPWMLRQRPEILAGELLAPTPYIAGHILNAFPMAYYATVVRTPEEARAAVRAQKTAGYDFIKIHNAMPQPVYDAVLAEAKAQHLDVVGHVPHQITIAHAIASGQRTLEHLKGYILDATLEISDEDWLTPTRGAEGTWNTPTLSCATRTNLRGAAARDLLASPEMQLVAPLVREKWRALAERPVTGPAAGLEERAAKVFRDLLAIHAPFLVGTDSGGGYDFMVPGFATHVEMELMEANGMAASDVLAAATRQPAVALRHEDDFGTLAPGLRADLLLLDRDPTASTANTRAIAGVMVRGRWLAREDLERIRARLAEIHATTAAWPAAHDDRQAMVRAHVEGLERLAASGFVLPQHAVDEYAAALEDLGFGALAERARALVAADRIR